MSKRPEYQLSRVEELFKTSAEREEEKLEKVQIVPAEEVYPYPREPYRVGRVTDDLVRLMDSIERVGIAEPMVVRPREEGGYEILAGHRRDYCARRLGIAERPVIVRNYDDDIADVLVCDYNITREDLLPSEKGRAYSLWMDGMRRVAGRPPKNPLQNGEDFREKAFQNSLQNGEDFRGKLSIKLLSEKVSENATNIQRYIRLTKLIRPLQDRVDEKKLSLVPAADYLYKLAEKEQKMVEELLGEGKAAPSVKQAQQMKRLSEAGQLTEEALRQIMEGKQGKERKLVLKEEQLQEYFPSGYTREQMEEVILGLLEDWRRGNGDRPACQA